MKILLVQPPAQNLIRSFAPKQIADVSGHYPPLGLLYLASYLRQLGGFHIEVIDSRVDGLDYDDIRRLLKEKRPDLVGIQTMTHTFVDALTTARIVKEVDPHCHVTLGGHHTEIHPLEIMEHPNVDTLVLGEGEIAFSELCRALVEGRSLAGIPGVVFRDGQKVVSNGPAPIQQDLDEIPFPARDLVPIKKYTNLMDPGKTLTTILASRGCPYGCAFCSEVGIPFRWRSAKRIVDEIEECQAMGVEDFFFFDDTFTAHRKQVFALCDEILGRKLRISFDIRARVNTVDRGMLLRLKEAGCRRIQFGVESGSPEVLQMIKKGITLEAAREAFRLAKELGFITFGDFMIGNPGETRQQIFETFALAKKLDPDYVQYCIFTPLPNTELYRLGIQKGLFGDFWRDYTKNPSSEFEPRLWEEILSKEELNRLLVFAYKDFYFRVRYVLGKIRQVRSLRELASKALAALRLTQIKGV